MRDHDRMESIMANREIFTTESDDDLDERGESRRI